jgi:rubrerythrin
MPPFIDFATLDLRSALDFAIAIEEDAKLRYQLLASTVTDPAAAEFFRRMVHNEGEHCRQLEARGDVLFRHAPRRLDTSEAPDLDAPGDGEVNASIGVREAMELALGAEHRAHEFYASAIPGIENPDVRAFFEELRQEEAEHEALLREQIAALDAAQPAR